MEMVVQELNGNSNGTNVCEKSNERDDKNGK